MMYKDKFEHAFKRIDLVARQIGWVQMQDRYVLTESEFRLMMEAIYMYGNSDGYVEGTIRTMNKTETPKESVND